MTQKVTPQWLALVGVVACFLFLAVTMVWILGWWRSAAMAGIYVVWAVGACTLTRLLDRRER